MAPIEIAGAAVVIGSCVFIAWREFIRARERRDLVDGDAV